MRSISAPVLLGNRLCLDFLNTEPLADGRPRETLATYQDLVGWARQAGALDQAEADFVMERWPRGFESDAALEAARKLRGHLRIAIDLVMKSGVVPAASIEAINAVLRNRTGFLQMEPTPDGWGARWKVPLRRPDDVLWRIARSAASVLSDDDPALIRRCERPACARYFYDTTKNHRKRWCSTDGCGAAERSAAYYRRKRS
jgi:predicted RNA-binding Zn ribbon-like protein